MMIIEIEIITFLIIRNLETTKNQYKISILRNGLSGEKGGARYASCACATHRNAITHGAT